MLRRKLAAMAWNGSAYLMNESLVLPARSSSHALYRFSNRASHGLPFEGGSMNARMSGMPRSRFRLLTITAARRSVSESGPGDEENGSHIQEKRKASKRSGGDKVAGGLIDDKEKHAIERQKALAAAVDRINKDFGGGVMIGGGDHGFKIEKMPSGCLSLDLVLGGGYPRGRIIEIFGHPSTGKTTLATHAIAEAQKLGYTAMLVDAEGAFAPAYSKRIGVDLNKLVIMQPDYGEMALESVDRIIRSGGMDIIVIDSVAALNPKYEMESEIGVQQMGSQARMMSSAVRKIAATASKCNCTVIFLNQIRNKVGLAASYGNPETTSGGMALKFYASVRIEVKMGTKFKARKGDKDVEIGFRGKGKIVKSKVSNPYRAFEYDMFFGMGISHLGCLVDCAESLDIITRKGSYYSYGEDRFHGRESMLQYLRENPEFTAEVEKAVRDKMEDPDALPLESFLESDDEDMPLELQEELRLEG